ncbi:hypothetical protein [Salinimicrobium oceani]|nr:hypothetical protein [Salinimicrobium oceani]
MKKKRPVVKATGLLVLLSKENTIHRSFGVLKEHWAKASRKDIFCSPG